MLQCLCFIQIAPITESVLSLSGEVFSIEGSIWQSFKLFVSRSSLSCSGRDRVCAQALTTNFFLIFLPWLCSLRLSKRFAKEDVPFGRKNEMKELKLTFWLSFLCLMSFASSLSLWLTALNYLCNVWQTEVSLVVKLKSEVI